MAALVTSPATITRAVVFRLYPNRTQAASLRRWQGALRFVWNHAWAWCQAQRVSAGKWPAKAGIQAHMVALKRQPETVWIADVPAHSILALAEDLSRAMRNWFDGRARSPRFRAKHQRQPSVYAVNQRTAYGDHSVMLPKLGAVRWRGGALPQGRLLSSRIYRDADKWFIASVFECGATPSVAASVARVGIDMGLRTFATIFDGQQVATVQSPKALRAHEVRLRRYQRCVSRRKKDSRRRERAKRAVARLHQRIANIRKDLAHKASTAIVARAQTIVVEDLNVGGMLNSALAKSVADAGMAAFLRLLHYKAAWNGRTLIKANRWFPSSRKCSMCGQPQAIPLSARRFCCACGNEMDRDENAARNLFAYREEPGNVGAMPETRGESGGQATGATRPPVPDAEPRTSKRPRRVTASVG